MRHQDHQHVLENLYLFRNDSYLDTTLLLPAKLDLAKLAFANGVTENIFAKLGVFLPFTVVVPAAATSSRFLAELLIGGGGDPRGGCSLVGSVGMGKSGAFSFAIDVDLGL